MEFRRTGLGSFAINDQDSDELFQLTSSWLRQGCSIAAEHTPPGPEVMGSSPSAFRAFFNSELSLTRSSQEGTSLVTLMKKGITNS